MMACLLLSDLMVTLLLFALPYVANPPYTPLSLSLLLSTSDPISVTLLLLTFALVLEALFPPITPRDSDFLSPLDLIVTLLPLTSPPWDSPP